MIFLIIFNVQEKNYVKTVKTLFCYIDYVYFFVNYTIMILTDPGIYTKYGILYLISQKKKKNSKHFY